MIEIKNLTKSYVKGKPVLQNVSLTVREGTVFGLVGINGSGKSTLLRIISGVLRGEGGQVCVDGEDVYENEGAKGKIFFLPDDPYYTSNVTASALADMYRAAYEFDDNAFRGYLEKFALNVKTPIRNFSKGMKRQVFVALALAVKPKYLLLDEAFDGLDPLARLVLKKALVELVEEKGTSVIISSHSLREMEDFCDSYVLLDKQTVSSSGDIAERITRFCKFQLAFKDDIAEDLFAGLPVASLEKNGRFVRVVLEGNAPELKPLLEALSPAVIEEMPMDFEEIFIHEVEKRGNQI